jgi:TnpA family transposase
VLGLLYKAFAELGKAIKTIFLVAIFTVKRFAAKSMKVQTSRSSGMAQQTSFSLRAVSNRREDHEVSILTLHLLQNSMVYINTLTLQ